MDIDWQEQFSEFVLLCRRWNPSSLATIVGASTDDVARVQRLAKLEVPPEYQAFLLAMGRTRSQSLGLFLQDFRFGISMVEQFYDARTVPPLPPDAVYWGVQQVDTAFDLFLRVGDLPRPLLQMGWAIDPESGDCLDKPPEGAMFAPGLMPFLYEEAFKAIRRPTFDSHAQLQEIVTAAKVADSVDAEKRARELQRVVETLGFRRLPFSHPERILYDRDDAGLIYYSNVVAADMVYVSADDDVELSRVADEVCRIGYRRR